MSVSRRIIRAYSHGPKSSIPLIEEETPELIRKAKSLPRDSHGDPGLWKKMSFFVALPLISLSALNSFLRKHEGHEHRAEFVEYEHLRIRTKPFPWGDGNHSLFHNKHTNAIPQVGYEA